jgi:hypothetical protein
MSTKFLVVGTLLRGALDRPETLDDDGQAAAYWQLRMDESQQIRVAYELGMCEARVEWKRKPVSREAPGRVDRMMQIAERIA